MRRLGWVFGLVLPAALLMFAPLRMALGWMDADRAGLSARSIDGTVWGGELRDARLRSLPLGDVRAALAPFHGGVALRTGFGHGVVQANGLSRVGADLPLAALAPGLPLDGQLGLRGFGVGFPRGACRNARGQVRVSNIRLGDLAPGALELRGEAACRDGRLALPLRGQSGTISLEALVSIDRRGVYQIDTRLQSADPLVGAAAQAAGFAQGLQGFSRTDRGRLGG